MTEVLNLAKSTTGWVVEEHTDIDFNIKVVMKDPNGVNMGEVVGLGKWALVEYFEFHDNVAVFVAQGERGLYLESYSLSQEDNRWHCYKNQKIRGKPFMLACRLTNDKKCIIECAHRHGDFEDYELVFDI